ncbi:MAG: hypothetical protein ABSB56_07945 [Nitrososphaerales archaeon]
MEPIIVLYTKGEAKRPYDRFDNFIDASFWIGSEYSEPEGTGNVKLVKIEMYSADDPGGLDYLKIFVNLLLDRAIDHETRFFGEPPPSGGSADSGGPRDSGRPPPPGDEAPPSEPEEPRSPGHEAEMKELREKRKKGGLSEKEYKAQRERLLKKWWKELDERMSK